MLMLALHSLLTKTNPEQKTLKDEAFSHPLGTEIHVGALMVCLVPFSRLNTLAVEALSLRSAP